MNDNRYRLSGMIHKSGTVATFWVISFVTARNITEASAGNPTHAPRNHQLGASAAAAKCRAGERTASIACSALARKVHQAQNAQHTANTAKPYDHITACPRESQCNSKKKG